MISDKLIQSWVDEGDLRTYKLRFLCEICLCANQQLKIDDKLIFTIKDLIKLGKVNYNQFAKGKRRNKKTTHKLGGN